MSDLDRQRLPEPARVKACRVSSDVGELWFPAEDQVMLPYLQTSGTWEPEEGALLRTLLRPGSRFLDVGANVGYFSVLAAQAAPGGTIDAVEPNSSVLELLRLNLWAHAPHARIWPVALGPTRGVGALSIETQNPGNTSVTASATATELVAIVPGDDLFEGRAFDVLKVDVQGYEVDVLSGMTGTLARSSPVRLVVEFFPGAIRSRGQEPRDVLLWYRDHGFDRVVEMRGRLERLEDDEILSVCRAAGPHGYLNLLLSR